MDSPPVDVVPVVRPSPWRAAAWVAVLVGAVLAIRLVLMPAMGFPT